MKVFDLKSDLPRADVAVLRLKNYVKMMKPTEKIIKVIHGYGSHGVGGKIRDAVRDTLEEMRSARQIKGYIPGEATTTLMGYDEEITRYKALLAGDSDFRKGNDGITYIIL